MSGSSHILRPRLAPAPERWDAELRDSMGADALVAGAVASLLGQ
jgi:hypothetical protein